MAENIPDVAGALTRQVGEGLRIPEGGAEAFTRAGQHAQQETRVLGNTAQDIYNLHEQHETNLDNSTIDGQKADAYNAVDSSLAARISKADPNDPRAIQKAIADWHEQDLPGIVDGLGQDASTEGSQAHAREARNEIRMYGTRYAAANGSVAVGQAVTNNFRSTVGAYTQLAGSDPAALADAHAGIDKLLSDTLDTAGVALKPEDRARILETEGQRYHHEADLAAAHTMAETNPVAFGEAVAQGKFKYLSGDDTNALTDHAISYGRAQIDFQHAQDVRQADSALQDAYSQLSVNANGQIVPTPEYVRRLNAYGSMPGAEASKYHAALSVMAAWQKDIAEGKTTSTDPRTYADFTHRMFLPDGDPHALSFADIDEARAGGKLSDKDWRELRDMKGDADKDPIKKDAYGQFEKQMGALRGIITKTNPLAGILDGEGDQRYAEFLTAARSRFDTAYKSGNWHGLLDRNELGKLAVQYANMPAPDPTKAAIGKVNYVAPPTEAPPKRNPGETPEQFLARSGAH